MVCCFSRESNSLFLPCWVCGSDPVQRVSQPRKPTAPRTWLCQVPFFSAGCDRRGYLWFWERNQIKIKHSTCLAGEKKLHKINHNNTRKLSLKCINTLWTCPQRARRAAVCEEGKCADCCWLALGFAKTHKVRPEAVAWEEVLDSFCHLTALPHHQAGFLVYQSRFLLGFVKQLLFAAF